MRSVVALTLRAAGIGARTCPPRPRCRREGREGRPAQAAPAYGGAAASRSALIRRGHCPRLSSTPFASGGPKPK